MIPFLEDRKQKGTTPLENCRLSPCPMAPRDAASRARFSTVTIARARIQVRFQLELELWLEFVSKFELIAIRNRKIARKWLLELASIAKVSKTIRKNGKG